VGTGIGHYVPLFAYLLFWVMCLLSLTGRPLLGLYYMMPFIPYRTMRDHFIDYPLGGNMLTILVIAVIIGALIKGKKLPKSPLFLIWLGFGIYLYLSMWLGTVLTSAPAPVWLQDPNFVTWKDYMLTPLIFLAASLVIEDRKHIRTVILILAFSLFLVDKSALLESLEHSWNSFDESKRVTGPLAYGSNQLAAFLAQFAMFFWGFAVFTKRFKYKLVLYPLVGMTVLTAMYTFSRASYIALIFSVFVLGLLKDRKLLVILGVFLLTWQTIVPTAVTERVSMTKDQNGQLEASAQERVDLWQQSQEMFLSSPVVGTGFATFQFGTHTDNLKDTHNWFVKVLVETGIIGGIFVLFMLANMLISGFRLFRKAEDPMYRGLGLGYFIACCSCIVANFFGDRWTYVEINGLLWILTGAVLRANALVAASTVSEEDPANPWAAKPTAQPTLPAPSDIVAHPVWR
jgi:putative inorganic carbon (HCO3(-)) transporter